MIKKTQYVLIALCFLSISIYADSPFPSKEQIGLFLNSKTYVVLDKNSMSMDAFLREAVDEVWELTDIEFTDREGFEEKRFSSKNSFIFISKLAFENDAPGVAYKFINLVLGDTARHLADMPEIAAIPLSFDNDPSLEYGFALKPILNFMQKHVQMIRDKYLIMKLGGMRYYNKNSGDVSDLPAFFLTENDLAPDLTVEGFKNIFEGKARFVGKNELNEVLDVEDNAAFLLNITPVSDVGRGRNYKLIFDNKGNLYYYSYHNIDIENPVGFNSTDLRKIN
jgi:hypothetical protein